MIRMINMMVIMRSSVASTWHRPGRHPCTHAGSRMEGAGILATWSARPWKRSHGRRSRSAEACLEVKLRH